jgi:uncharacterized FAD-dependent dehydrogenase
MQRVMELFHHFGAKDNILYEAHAHIGSDKLPSIIRAMRECIIEHGGEIHFDTCISSLSPFASGVPEKSADFWGALSPNSPTILAIGHSAHDTYQMLMNEGVLLEDKGCAMGVRAEHPQTLINKLMYHDPSPELVKLLGNASYSLVTQVQGRGVYSFCMCPGGHIVPAGSALNSCVVNGMSASHRNSPFANSGMVVEIRPEDLTNMVRVFRSSGVQELKLKGLAFQQHLEYLAYQHGGHPSLAPAQRLKDFVEGRPSKSLPACSYLPGMVSSRLDEWLPAHIGKRLQQGFRDFDRKYRGFLTNEAVILGVESRSSSAVRIPRDPKTLQSVSTPGLYPCGEGAGYAGGITSCALDGINVAWAIIHAFNL